MQVLNPPFVPFSTSDNTPNGAFTAENCTPPTATATPSLKGTPTPTLEPTPRPTPPPTTVVTLTATPAPTRTATFTPTSTPTVSPTATATPSLSITGKVETGVTFSAAKITPVSNSELILYAAGGTTVPPSDCKGLACYGAGATALGSGRSDDSGAFTIRYNGCPGGSVQTYVVALGGDGGGGTNPEIGLMALTGPCGNLSSSTFVTVDELTTAAAGFALSNFSDATGQIIGTSPDNIVGLANAFNVAMTNLVTTVGSGLTGTLAPFWANAGATQSNCAGKTPAVNCTGLDQLESLASDIEACVVGGTSSSACKNFDIPAGGTTLFISGSGMALNYTNGLNHPAVHRD